MTAATLQVLAILVCNWSVMVVSGFSTIAIRRYSSSYINDKIISSSSSLYAGFGAKSTKKDNKSNKEIKLKPKQQWDRYVELKSEPSVAVAVRMIDGTDEWLDVGSVKSQDSKYTSQAVFRQRALIAEHAKRLHPGQINKKQQQLQWGYKKDDGEEEGQWVIVDKSCMIDYADTVSDEGSSKGLEKLVGFKGLPDPVSGFYTEKSISGMDASSLGKKNSSGGSVTGSNKKGPGDGVI